MVPGLLCDRRVFAATMGRLQAAAEVVVVPPRLLSPRGGSTMARVADAVLESVTAPTFALAGFSYGGYVALAMAAAAPERVSHLALISSQVRGDTPTTTARREAQVAGAEASGSLAEVMVSQAHRLLAPDHLPPGGDAAIRDAAAAVAAAAAGGKAGPDDAAAAVRGALAAARCDSSGGWGAFATVVEMGLCTSVGDFVAQQHIIKARPDASRTLVAAALRGIPIAIAGGSQDALIPPRVATDMYRAATNAAVSRTQTAGGPAAAGSAAGMGGGTGGRHLGHTPGQCADCVTLTMSARSGHMLPLEDPDALQIALSHWLSQASPLA